MNILHKYNKWNSKRHAKQLAGHKISYISYRLYNGKSRNIKNMACLFLKYVLISNHLKSRVARRDRDIKTKRKREKRRYRRSSICWFILLNEYNKQSWLSQAAASSLELHLVSHLNGRDSSSGAIIRCLPSHLAWK